MKVLAQFQIDLCLHHCVNWFILVFFLDGVQIFSCQILCFQLDYVRARVHGQHINWSFFVRLSYLFNRENAWKLTLQRCHDILHVSIKKVTDTFTAIPWWCRKQVRQHFKVEFGALFQNFPDFQWLNDLFLITWWFVIFIRLTFSLITAIGCWLSCLLLLILILCGASLILALHFQLIIFIISD